MRKAVLAIALISIFSAPALWAQNQTPNNGRRYGGAGGHGPNIAAVVQHQVARLTVVLTLTPGQISQVTDLLTKNATSNQALFASMRSAQESLHAAEASND